MPLVPDVETDLRYLDDAPCHGFETWTIAGSPFERKLAANLRPRMCLDLDLQTLARVLGTAVLLRDVTVTLDLQLQPGRALAQVVAIEAAGLPPICADDSANFLYALGWFQERGERSLRVSIQGDSYFWIHAPGVVARTKWAEPERSSTTEVITQ